VSVATVRPSSPANACYHGASSLGMGGRLRRAARRARAALGPRVVVLMYHRIADPRGTDPFNLCVTPERFAQQMDVLARFGRVMRLTELADALSAGRLPRRAAVVTFDDGYVDNLEVAKPVLQRFGLPATVFMTAGDIGRAREFWWDELEGLLLQPGALSRELRIDQAGIEWDLGEQATYTEADRVCDAGWGFDEPPRGARQKVFRDVYYRLWPLGHAERLEVLDRLLAAAGRAPMVRPERRAMTPAEMCKLAHGGLIEVGAHTVTHPYLPARPADEQRREAVESRARLREILDHDVTSFAYPYGAHDEAVVRAVADAGFKRACVCMGHAVRPSSELLRLTRADTGDWDAATFERRLHDAFAQ
jgi:peptidoglycan/xylan/chitin deacetylase (PgdA/CDA1 family)